MSLEASLIHREATEIAQKAWDNWVNPKQVTTSQKLRMFSAAALPVVVGVASYVFVPDKGNVVLATALGTGFSMDIATSFAQMAKDASNTLPSFKDIKRGFALSPATVNTLFIGGWPRMM